MWSLKICTRNSTSLQQKYHFFHSFPDLQLNFFIKIGVKLFTKPLNETDKMQAEFGLKDKDSIKAWSGLTEIEHAHILCLPGLTGEEGPPLL